MALRTFVTIAALLALLAAPAAAERSHLDGPFSRRPDLGRPDRSVWCASSRRPSLTISVTAPFPGLLEWHLAEQAAIAAERCPATAPVTLVRYVCCSEWCGQGLPLPRTGASASEPSSTTTNRKASAIPRPSQLAHYREPTPRRLRSPRAAEDFVGVVAVALIVLALKAFYKAVKTM